MAFSVYEVVRVTRRKQTNYATDKPRERLRKKRATSDRMVSMFSGREKNLYNYLSAMSSLLFFVL